MQEVVDWLEKLGMSEYKQRFAENGIGIAALRHLTDQDLKEIGVLLGHRRIMLAAIGELARTVGPVAQGSEVRRDAAERRQLTIMFCDLVGSTTLSTRLDPEDMREIIGAYHRCCSDQIVKAGGFVAKYMGDGVLAYFGYPQAHEDDAERGVGAALALIGHVQTLHLGLDAELQVRIGIATGLVVVGDLVGEGAAQEQGVVGETPNVAARLQALAEPGQVVISDGTRRLTGGMFEYHDLGRVSLKGLATPAQAWQVTGVNAAQSRFEAHHETYLTPLVGREEELELLMRRWHQAANGEGQVVLLVGEPGIGKSRLTVTLEERLQHEPHTRVRYFCSPHHTDSAFYPLIAQLEGAANFQRQDAPETKLDKLLSRLDQPSNHDSDIQLLTELLSIPTGDRYAPLNVSPKRKKEKTFEALLRQLEGLTRRQPVLVVYEDVHWIDPSSRELLDMTVEQVATLPVLLIITFRPEFQSPWTGQSHVSMLSLSHLGRRDGAALVELVAGNSALSDEVMAEIVERTDGIPLFAEELTKAVVEAAAVDGRLGKTVAASLAVPDIPATLHASLMARLDRVGSAAREVAQVGAAIGREFGYDLLARVASKGEDALIMSLKRLTETGLVYCRGTPPDATVLFKHALVRDVAYGSLLRTRRQRLHARIVSVLEDQFPETVTTAPELLAQHAAAAGSAEKAVVYWLAAGQRSAERSATKETLTHLRNGLERLPTVGDGARRLELELDLQVALGRAYMAAEGYGSAKVGAAYARARELCNQLDRPVQLVPVLYGQWINHVLRAELGRAKELAEEISKFGGRNTGAAVKPLGYRYRGTTAFFLGDFVAARSFLDKAISLYDPEYLSVFGTLEPQDTRVAMLVFLSHTLLCLGYVDQARRCSEDGLARARAIKHGFMVAYVLGQSAFGKSIKSAPALLPLAEELRARSDDFAQWRAQADITRGWCLGGLGREEEGIAPMVAGIGALLAHGTVNCRAFWLTLLAEVYGKARRPQQGLECLAEAVALAERTQERWAEAETYRVRGELLVAIHEEQAAAGSLFRAIAIAQGQSAKLFELRASTSLARLWRDQGKRTEARDLVAPVYGWFTEGFDTPDLKEARALLDELM
jgi:class 3 adenylate cyclase/predicted ATPase